MGKIACDLCGGPLIINVGGKTAVCKVCGMEHSIDRVREMLGGSARPEGAPPTSDPVVQNVGHGSSGAGDVGPAAKKTAPVQKTVAPRMLHCMSLEELEDEKKAAKPGNYRLIARLVYKIARIIKNNFQDYEVEYMADPAQLDATFTYGAPIHFLFKKDGKPVLAVVVVTKGGYKLPLMEGTEKACERANVRYMRFFCNCDYPNKTDYIRERIRQGLTSTPQKLTPIPTKLTPPPTKKKKQSSWWTMW